MPFGSCALLVRLLLANVLNEVEWRIAPKLAEPHNCLDHKAFRAAFTVRKSLDLNCKRPLVMAASGLATQRSLWSPGTGVSGGPEAEGFGRYEVDDQLERHRLFDGQLGVPGVTAGKFTVGAITNFLSNSYDGL